MLQVHSTLALTSSSPFFLIESLCTGKHTTKQTSLSKSKCTRVSKERILDMTKEEREKFKREEAHADAQAKRHGGLLAVDGEMDTLLDKGSTTPLMAGGAGGLLRVSALFVVAIMLMIKRSLAPSSGPHYGGLEFPAEVKFSDGQFQTLLGGSGATAGAVGVYLQHVPADGDWGVLSRYVGLSPAELLAPQPEGQLDVFVQIGHANTLTRSLLFMFDGSASVKDMLDEIKKHIDGISSEADSATRAGETFLAVVDAATPPPDEVPGRTARIYVTCHGEEMMVTYATAHAVQVMRKSSHVPTGGMAVPSTASDGPVCPLLFDAYLGVVTELQSEDLRATDLRATVADGFRAHTGVFKDEM